MAYNIPDYYENTTPSAPLDQKTLNKMAWRSVFLQGSFNYERMQAAGWLYSILPGLEKIHGDNKEDLAASMSHNLEFFNTHPFLVTFVMGIVLSMEQHKADIPTIRAVRVAAMGPLGGIGDALFWFTLVPITAGICSNMAINGSIFAPFLFLIIFNVAQFALRYWLMNWSYKMGTSAIDILTQNAKEFTRAASILGVFIVGCLTVCYGGTALNVNIPNGTTFEATTTTTVVSNDDLMSGSFDKLIFSEGNYVQYKADPESVKLQGGAEVVDLENGNSRVTIVEQIEKPVTIDIQKILDGICPKIIPLAITMMLYGLMTKRNWTPIKCIGLLLLIGLLGSGFGVFPVIWA